MLALLFIFLCVWYSCQVFCLCPLCGLNALDVAAMPCAHKLCLNRKGLRTRGQCVCLGVSRHTHAQTHHFGSRRPRSGRGSSLLQPSVDKKYLFDFLMVVSSLIYFSVRRARVECDIFATGHCALYLLDLVLISLCTHSCAVLWKGRFWGVNSEEIPVGCQTEPLFR